LGEIRMILRIPCTRRKPEGLPLFVALHLAAQQIDDVGRPPLVLGLSELVKLAGQVFRYLDDFLHGVPSKDFYFDIASRHAAVYGGGDSIQM
jgi:hypothetical protein